MYVAVAVYQRRIKSQRNLCTYQQIGWIYNHAPRFEQQSAVTINFANWSVRMRLGIIASWIIPKKILVLGNDFLSHYVAHQDRKSAQWIFCAPGYSNSEQLKSAISGTWVRSADVPGYFWK